MTTQNDGPGADTAAQFTVPHRMELTFVLPGTAEQLWDAIATANGISSWMLPTDVEERVGGAICYHMGPDMSSEGTVTGFDAPHRFAIVEPEWALLVGQDPASVTPLATEFLIEAQSGGTCVLRVVTSAFGTGADWEHEFFADMEKNWVPQFDNLRVYLAHYAGKRVVSMDIEAPAPTASAAMRSM
ncbi:MAG: SRPBCC domain-containing protein [Acidimicrobiales bacterium]